MKIFSPRRKRKRKHTYTKILREAQRTTERNIKTLWCSVSSVVKMIFFLLRL